MYKGAPVAKWVKPWPAKLAVAVGFWLEVEIFTTVNGDLLYTDFHYYSSTVLILLTGPYKDVNWHVLYLSIWKHNTADIIKTVTVKILITGTPEINYHNCPTIGTVGFYSAVLCSKDADRITNREDPDQTAPWGAVWSGSALFAQTYLSQYLKLLRYLCTSL